MLSPRSIPSAQGPRPGLGLLCTIGDSSHRDSLSGLCQSPCDQVQAGESTHTSHCPPASGQSPQGSWGDTRFGIIVNNLERPGHDNWGRWGEECHRNFRSDSFLGVIPKPSIWADPGPIITEGNPVTIWCQGSLWASAYILYKERASEPLDTRIPQDSSNKAGFLIEVMTSLHAGLYQCAYNTTGDILSEPSDLLLLVVTGK